MQKFFLEKFRTVPVYRVFIASPSDVGEERTVAEKVIRNLRNDESEFYGKVFVEPILWERLALEAWISPQKAIQLGLPTPGECDVVVVIFWKRMGTPLSLGEYRKPNGNAYMSGTEWELEDARHGFETNKTGKPKIFLYRRKDESFTPSEDKEGLEQLSKVNGLFDAFKEPNGAFLGNFYTYQSMTEFRRLLKSHLQQAVKDLLELPSLPDDLHRDDYLQAIPADKYSIEEIRAYITNIEHPESLRSRAIAFAVTNQLIDNELIERILHDESIDLRRDFASYASQSQVPLSEEQLKHMLTDKRDVALRAVDVAASMARRGLYTSLILRYAGPKAPNVSWEVRYRAVWKIIELNDGDSVKALSAFKDASYFLTRQMMVDYFAELVRDNRLDQESLQTGIELIKYCIEDGESSLGTLKKLRKVYSLLAGEIKYPEYSQ